METISVETQQLIDQAGAVYKKHFSMKTCFERAIFFSWWCGINDCGFCFMSALDKDKVAKETAIRHESSILAETWLCKKIGWEFGFFSGGINAFNADKVEDLLKKINIVYGQKVWINIGAVPQRTLERYAPYIRGVVGSIETVNEEVHKKACPSKPALPYFRMFENAHTMGLDTAMTFIVGLGETKDDLPLLLETITKYNISKIHVYGLVPHEGTEYANAEPPTTDEQAWWIAQIRLANPTIDIQCGIWSDRIARTSVLLHAGANSISKLPVFRKFGTPIAFDLEEQAALAGRDFEGSLTVLPELDLSEIDAFGFDEELTALIKKKAERYIKLMQKNLKKNIIQIRS
jgi:biotin synthase-like enzyme